MDHFDDENVLDRLKRMTRIARQNGFEIRGEPLDGTGCTWCEIRGKRILFLDLTQTAAEQALAIAEILETTRLIRPNAPVAASTRSEIRGVKQVA
ncbi:hypothetical protein LOC71_18740 [Rhodopirellula sp. JC740]|uniref:Uncharacterized protein n=1 Tax=Rhodopirellula halodulae TaxID=2894198 RepID=A0ABS8NL94_9BACT|nr:MULTISPECIES: hypothetical protein [unclassified Rhodopirellula]MCC9644320.1 hypothetical protein [Rhodopirellula sp. JC740]MCC9657483.1 hypothetical protein [Rhodopirellula sp. JC737]